MTLKNSLYDTYKMAIRWASDRINEQGIVAFVTNGSWIDGNVDAGVRACLAEEFSSIYVLHLRGNATHSGGTIASRGRQGVRSGVKGAGGYHDSGEESEHRARWLPHSLPGHR